MSSVMPRLEGYLKKLKSKSYFGVAWNKRWFAVDAIPGTENRSFHLKYYNDKPPNKQEKANGTINLISITNIVEYNSSMNTANQRIGDPFVFVIESPDRKFILRANSQMEMCSWMDGLRAYVEHEKRLFEQAPTVQIAQISHTPAIPAPETTEQNNNNIKTVAVLAKSETTTPIVVSNNNNNNNNKSSSSSKPKAEAPKTPPKRNSLVGGEITNPTNVTAAASTNNNTHNTVTSSSTKSKQQSQSSEAAISNAPAPVIVQARVNSSSVQSPNRPTLINNTNNTTQLNSYKPSAMNNHTTTGNNNNNGFNNKFDEVGDDDFSLDSSRDSFGQSTDSLDLNLDEDEEPTKPQKQDKNKENTNQNKTNTNKIAQPEIHTKSRSIQKQKPPVEYEEKVAHHTNNAIDLEDDWDSPAQGKTQTAADTPILHVARPLKMGNKSKSNSNKAYDDEENNNESLPTHTKARSGFRFDVDAPPIPDLPATSQPNNTIATKTAKTTTSTTSVPVTKKPPQAVVSAQSSDAFAEHVLKADENFVEENWD